MATFAIGDIQGCYETLRRLLDRCGFDPGSDRLWLVGDLVNRGPRSLEALRWARSMQDRLTMVLGNHDLHLLGRAFGVRKPKRRDTLNAILDAPDRAELLGWLRRRPLLHDEGGRLLVHAGLLPEWTLDTARGLARELEQGLADVAPARVLETVNGSGPPRWDERLGRADRLRVALRAFTRLRTLTADGHDCPDFSGPPERAPDGCRPWYELASRRGDDVTIVCGHWAALGLRLQKGLVALDTGCVWGGTLTALRLDDRRVFQEPLAD
jgi:bis(5'-nucleosyl)-tetraphosphatase (symmetrical)